jgi:subtilisin family serine protease
MADRHLRRLLSRYARLHLERLEDRSMLDAGLTGVSQQLLVTLRSGEIQTVPVEEGVSVEERIARYQADPSVAFAEIDRTVRVEVIPNDPHFSRLWGLYNIGQTGGRADADIDADQAWDLSTGSMRTVVGVIDTGIDYTHPDLYLNIWLNPGEIPRNLGVVDLDGDNLITFRDLNDPRNFAYVTDINRNNRIDAGDLLRDGRWANRVDNDGNGKIDDLVGWDFRNNDNDPFDDHLHGTHVAGTIGAIGNNGRGLTGINWKVQLAALKFLGGDGDGRDSGAIAALHYAVNMGMRISNNSWGGGGYSATMASAIARARTFGHIFVAAAGNDGSNNDAIGHYPSNYGYDNVLSVAATTHLDTLASFSNFGPATVDIGAPGAAIFSTVPGSAGTNLSGTSMAAPHAAGAAALVWSTYPNLTYQQVIIRLAHGGDLIPALTHRTLYRRRLNVLGALRYGQSERIGPYITAMDPIGDATVAQIRVSFSEAISASSFTPADVTDFYGPNGAIAVSSVRVVAGTNNTRFDIFFAAQSAPGDYALTIGPQITDLVGNRMDQDRDGTLAEDEDAYFGMFSLSNIRNSTFFNQTPLSTFNTGTVSSRIHVPYNRLIHDVNVRFGINHRFDGDLTIWLVSPSGVRVDLVKRRGGGGRDFIGTTLDDEATLPIASGSAPFAGRYQPESSLSVYDGDNMQGIWTLYIQDDGTLNRGTLQWWSLTFTGELLSLGRGEPGESRGDPPTKSANQQITPLAGLASFLTEDAPTRRDETPTQRDEKTSSPIVHSDHDARSTREARDRFLTQLTSWTSRRPGPRTAPWSLFETEE